MKEYKPIPKVEEVEPIERENAFGAYLMMFATIAIGLPLPIINILAAVIYHLTNKNKGDFVRFHSLQSMLSAIFIGIFNLLCISIVVYSLFYTEFEIQKRFLGLGICFIIVNLFYITLSIMGAARAKKGRMYYFPFFGKLAYMMAFQIRSKKNNTEENQPPI